LYIRLLLGHFVGDFILQFDKIHALKFKNRWGLLLHVLIVTGCLATFCWPYVHESTLWFFLAFIGTTHYVQDWAKIKFTGIKHGFFFFLLDQALHILFISAVFLTNLQNVPAPFNENRNFLLNLYNNDVLALYIVALIIVSYMAHYLIILFKTDYLKINGAISSFEKRYGFMERIILLSASIVGNLWLIVIPLVLMLRPFLFRTLRHQLNISDRFASSAEIALSGAAVILTGLVFGLFL
jgi:hypothetical protein